MPTPPSRPKAITTGTKFIGPRHATPIPSTSAAPACALGGIHSHARFEAVGQSPALSILLHRRGRARVQSSLKQTWKGADDSDAGAARTICRALHSGATAHMATPMMHDSSMARRSMFWYTGLCLTARCTSPRHTVSAGTRVARPLAARSKWRKAGPGRASNRRKASQVRSSGSSSRSSGQDAARVRRATPF